MKEVSDLAGGAVFDAHELDELTNEMVRFVAKEYPKEAKKFLTKEANEGRRILRTYTKKMTTKHTGNLLKGIDKSPARKKGGDWQVRVRNKAPHAWLVEHGHGLVAWGNPTDKRVEGKHFAARAQKSIKKWFPKDTERWIDQLLKEGFR